MIILIVDDLNDARQVLRYMVKKNGHEAIEVANGLDALTIAKSSPPDLIISDALMPVMDGFQFLRALKQEPELMAIPFVFYSSSYKEEQAVRLAMSLGANAYFFKPMDPIELWGEIEGVLEKAKQNVQYPAELIKEDAEYLRRYSEVVATKLEKKVLELEKTLAEGKRVEMTLHENIARTSAITDSAQDAIVMMDQNGRIFYWNPAAERIFGYTNEEAIGLDLHQLIAPQRYHEESHAAYSKFQQKGQGTGIDATLELEACHQNGHEISVELSFSAFHGQDGWHSVGIIRDVSERKRTEERLKHQKDELSSIFENAPCMMMVLDGKKRIRRVNTLTCSFTGLSISDIVGRRVGEVLHCLHCLDTLNECSFASCCLECTLHQTFMDTYETGQNHFQVEVLFPTSIENKKQQNIFLISSTRIIVDKAPLVLLSLQDITEHRKLEEQFRQAQKMEAVGTLAGGVVHDFNNMLGVIRGYAEIALDCIDPAQPIFTHIQAIIQAAEHSADLTRQLLAFARRQAITPKVLDLNRTVEGMIKILRRLISEDIELVWLPQTEVWLIKMDPSQIDQLLANLCVNARDAIAGVGKITIETHSLTIDTSSFTKYQHPEIAPGDYVLLSVSDDGSGMDKGTLDKLFEPFFTTKERGKGTGLGLATVYGIVKQNNAFIYVSSEPGQGATFDIFLPRYMSKNVDVKDKRSVAQVLGGNETILLVEDEPAVLEMTKVMLNIVGYHVLTASSPSDAIKLVKKHAAEIHLLITDVILPEMNGRELVNRLLPFCPDLKVLYMSGYTSDVIVRQSVLAEGINFIQKPFPKDILTTRVREVLGKCLVEVNNPGACAT